MTSQHDKVKRWRPRFSVRTLVIVVTLACCYLGLWQATKLRGGNDVVLQSLGMVENSRYAYAEAIGPLLVNKTLDCGRGSNRRLKDHYYFWCFGYVAKLPFEREI